MRGKKERKKRGKEERKEEEQKTISQGSGPGSREKAKAVL